MKTMLITVILLCGLLAAEEANSALQLARLLEQQAKQDILLIHVPEGGHSTTYDDARKALVFAISGAGRQR